MIPSKDLYSIVGNKDTFINHDADNDEAPNKKAFVVIVRESLDIYLKNLFLKKLRMRAAFHEIVFMSCNQGYR